MNILDVREMQLETCNCILTSIAPLRKDNLAQGQFSCESKQFSQREVTVYCQTDN